MTSKKTRKPNHGEASSQRGENLSPGWRVIQTPMGPAITDTPEPKYPFIGPLPLTAEQEKVCRNCASWVLESAEIGACRRSPPVGVDGDGIGAWPRTLQDSFCGEFKHTSGWGARR